MNNSENSPNEGMNIKPQTDWFWENHKRSRRMEEIEREKRELESQNNGTYNSDIETLKEEHKKLRMPWESSI